MSSWLFALQVEKVVFCQFSDGAQKTYEKVMPRFFPIRSTPGQVADVAEGDESILETEDEPEDGVTQQKQ